MRVKKGLKRVVELLFWGYLLQVYAFHVLQCIGIGIFFILVIYGLFKLLKIVPLWFLFFLAGTAVFSLNLYFIHFEDNEYWPANAPSFIQNMFKLVSIAILFKATFLILYYFELEPIFHLIPIPEELSSIAFIFGYNDLLTC